MGWTRLPPIGRSHKKIKKHQVFELFKRRCLRSSFEVPRRSFRRMLCFASKTLTTYVCCFNCCIRNTKHICFVCFVFFIFCIRPARVGRAGLGLRRASGESPKLKKHQNSHHGSSIKNFAISLVVTHSIIFQIARNSHSIVNWY